MTAKLFTEAWCGVGGKRGGELVPRWFFALPELGVENVHLFWSIPEDADPDGALDRLRSASTRWMADLQRLGLASELAIKRGAPAAWLSALAGLRPGALVVVGPSAVSGSASTTIYDLLNESPAPILLLPDLVHPPALNLLARPVIDVGMEPIADDLLGALAPEHAEPHLLDLSLLEPPEAVLTALRIAEDVDASLVVLPRRAEELVPYALQRSNFPLLVWPPRAGLADGTE